MSSENSSRTHDDDVAFLQNSSAAASSLLNYKNDIWPWRIGLFGVGGACIASLGVVCNCITIVVLAHYKDSHTRSSTPVLLIFLEVFNTIFLLFELFLENLAYMAQGGIVPDTYRKFITPVYCVTYPVAHTAWTCATFLVVIITIERYVVINWPLSAHNICRPTNAKLAVMIVAIGSVLYNIPLYMAFTCPRVWDNSTQTERIRFSRSEFGSSFYFVQVHMTWVKLCVNFLIPFVLLLTFNALLLSVLWRRSIPLCGKSQRHARKEKKLTIMVVCMIGVFLICELMSAVAFILTSGLDKYTECSYHCNRFTAIADTLVIVNAAANFAIYCASGEKFRDIFSQIFLKRLCLWPCSSSNSSRSSTRLQSYWTNLTKKHSHTESSLKSNGASPSASATLSTSKASRS